MAYNDVLSAYINQVNQLVGSKVSEDSIDPTDVAAIGIQLANLLLPILNSINDFGISGGAMPPDNGNGVDLDLYIQGGTSLVFWRKRNGIWNQEASVDLGIQIIDGNITLQASVNEFVVTVSAGSWGINNIIYNKAVQTQLDIAAADLNFNRIDSIIANTSGDISIISGLASANPNPVDLPANSIIVAYVYVPASSSGDLPYISDSNSSPTTIIDDTITNLTKTWSSQKIAEAIASGSSTALTFTQANLIMVDEGNYSLSFNLPVGKSIVSIERLQDGVISRSVPISNAFTIPANNPNTNIEGFDNNGPQTITIKIA